ncbi:MAG: diadenylate cyclase [Candidatus Omnitrophica bacterium]|nr:diadenylate cyclase [Candidatus Omnitrophota bacterium]MBU1923467.1 diadenylate cyclase [Candidatus Omnitrophota bacterium]
MINKIFDYVTEFFQTLRFVDFIDIGIIAIFVYIILVWLEKARVRFILIGMIILGFIYILARLFGLYLTTMVFQAFFAIFLIMIVVIFQDDFRHFFERIAIWGIARRRPRVASQDYDIAMLTSGLANLSRKKIGTLIVVQGQDPLDRYLEAGIHSDALLSQMLIESIFEPNSPSHDGAIIIEGTRLAMFGCHLPLSTNIEEVGHLGTRHAAALGLAERTDALCIAISEERGTISVAEEGKITQLKDIGELPNILERFYREKFPAKHRAFSTDFLKGHFLEKVIAIILASGLWLAFGHRSETIRRDFVIPIEYRNLTRDRIISETKPKEVTITLSGSERAFNLLDAKELKLSMDMLKVKEGEDKYYLNKDMVRKPAGLSLVNIEPKEIPIRVYKMISVTIPIQIKTNGRAPSGVTIKEIKIEPQNVSVKIPDVIDQKRLSITTEPIELKSITETITLVPKLIIPSEIRFPGDKPPEVKITVEVEKA